MNQYNKALEEALERNSEDTKRWEKYQEELNQTATSLKEFIKSVDVSIMVPLGKKALVRGKLIHTNEVTVSHGSSMFTDCSQNQALEIVQHRLKLSSEKLKALKTEKTLFRGKLELPITENLFSMNDPNCQEIIEDYVEEEELKWRKKHQESVKKQKLEESEKWKKATCNKDKSHEDVIKLLEDLELMEELDAELDTLEVHDDESLRKLMDGNVVPDSKKRISFLEAVNVNGESENAVIEPTLTSSGTTENNEIVSLLKGYRSRIDELLKNVEKNDELLDLFLDLSNLKEELDDDIDQLIPEEDEENVSEDSEDYSEQTSNKTASIVKILDPKVPAAKNVKFSDSFDVKLIEFKDQKMVQDGNKQENTLNIKIKHSKNVFKPDTESTSIVAHPADIYKKFQHCFNATTTKKSILKRRDSTGQDNDVVKIEAVKNQQVEVPVVKIYDGDVLGDIVEKKNPKLSFEENIVHIQSKSEVKKVSKFKQMRQKC